MTPENMMQERKSVRRVAYGYDLFLSHNRADKDWVRKLATRLADHTYNGRALRPWLDEQVLDPGEDVREAELTTALDRSRLFVIVLSPIESGYLVRLFHHELDASLRSVHAASDLDDSSAQTSPAVFTM